MSRAGWRENVDINSYHSLILTWHRKLVCWDQHNARICIMNILCPSVAPMIEISFSKCISRTSLFSGTRSHFETALFSKFSPIICWSCVPMSFTYLLSYLRHIRIGLSHLGSTISCMTDNGETCRWWTVITNAEDIALLESFLTCTSSPCTISFT